MIEGYEVALLVLGSLALTSLLMPLAFVTLRRAGIVDEPNHRSSHDRTTVRGGGVACTVGVLGCSCLAHLIGIAVPWVGIVVALALSLLGMVDDARRLSALIRLLGQVIAGAAIGLAVGGGWALLIGCVVVPIAVNAVNFMDGINGISAFTVSAWAVVVMLAGTGELVASVYFATLALGTAGAFVPWNVPRARMFLGDSGSYLYGGLISAAVLHAPEDEVPVLAVVAPLAIYLFDTGYTLVARLRRGDSITSAHREHLYQRLTSGERWPHIRTAGLVACLSLGTGLAWTMLYPVGALLVTCAVLSTYVHLARHGRQMRGSGV